MKQLVRINGHKYPQQNVIELVYSYLLGYKRQTNGGIPAVIYLGTKHMRDARALVMDSRYASAAQIILLKGAPTLHLWGIPCLQVVDHPEHLAFGEYEV